MRRSIDSLHAAALATLFLIAVSSCGSTAAPTAEHSTAHAQAPDFEFASGYGWRHLHDLCAEGRVLLVFGANDAALAELQRQLPHWRAIGVEPIAVRTSNDGDNWMRLEHLGLTYALLSDANDALATRFGMAEIAAASNSGSWCLVDERMQIRRRAAGAPSASDLEATATLLGGAGEVAAASQR